MVDDDGDVAVVIGGGGGVDDDADDGVNDGVNDGVDDGVQGERVCVQRRYRDVRGVAVSLVADEDEGERCRVVDARALDELRVPHADLLERRLQLDCVRR